MIIKNDTVSVNLFLMMISLWNNLYLTMKYSILNVKDQNHKTKNSNIFLILIRKQYSMFMFVTDALANYINIATRNVFYEHRKQE